MIKKIVLLVSVLLTLAACGGGGGSGSGVVASTLTFPLQQININQLVNSSSAPFTVSGTMNGYSVTGTGNLTDGTLSAATFEGNPAQQQITTITGSITVNGQTSSLGSSSTTYVDSNYLPLGVSDTSEYTVMVTANPIPSSVHVNDTGTLATGNRYTNSTKSTLLDTLTMTYVIEADTATTALLSVINKYQDMNGTITETSINQYRIGADGTSSRVKSTGSFNTSTTKGNLTYTF